MVTPIRPDVVPALDVEREMLSFVAEKLADYTRRHGEPLSIALALIGQDRAESATEAFSWSPADEDRSRLHTCAVASAVLMKRAIGA